MPFTRSVLGSLSNRSIILPSWSQLLYEIDSVIPSRHVLLKIMSKLHQSINWSIIFSDECCKHLLAYRTAFIFLCNCTPSSLLLHSLVQFLFWDLLISKVFNIQTYILNLLFSIKKTGRIVCIHPYMHQWPVTKSRYLKQIKTFNSSCYDRI